MTLIKGEGGIEVEVVADSVSAHTDQRIVTMALRYPRFIHSEFMTHRVFSRNASSSRAIPTKKLLEQVRTDPAMPIHWGANKPGMQAGEELDDVSIDVAKACWKNAALEAAEMAEAIMEAGAHKQVANRLLEPFMFMRTIVTATEWDNFFKLRDHPAAEPTFQELAKCMRIAMEGSTPESLAFEAWHLPYVKKREIEEYFTDTCIKLSVARCARVSYLNHDKTEPVVEDDIELYNMLAVRPYEGKNVSYDEDDPVHLSPLEHQAMVRSDLSRSNNFNGWMQYREFFEFTEYRNRES